MMLSVKFSDDKWIDMELNYKELLEKVDNPASKRWTRIIGALRDWRGVNRYGVEIGAGEKIAFECLVKSLFDPMWRIPG